MLQRLLQILAALTGDHLAHRSWERPLPDHGRMIYRLGSSRRTKRRKPRPGGNPVQLNLPMDPPTDKV